MSKIKELVRIEADNLKRFATEEELDRLHFGRLEASVAKRCIYGQMTGFCYSERAHELIMNCAVRVYNTPEAISHPRLNGKPRVVSGEDRKFEYHSPIEVFIYKNEANLKRNLNERLVDYLKGKTETLDI